MNKNLTISILIILSFFLAIYYLNRNKSVNENGEILKISKNCLELTEQLMPSHIKLTEWDAVEIDQVNEISVSIDNQHAKVLQESTRTTGGYITNYGPFIMEKTLEKGGKPIPETNPELIECYKTKIQIGLWR